MKDRLEIIKNRYDELNKELSKEEVLNDFEKLKTLSQERSELEEIVNKANEYDKILEDLEELSAMKNDPEMSQMVSEEYDSLTSKKEKVFNELQMLLIPKDENDGKNIIMEIRGAAGGDEANIFAGDLFRMYSKYAEKEGFKLSVIHSVDGSSGGYSQIECLIKGENVYSKLKYESGSHRVQRIPVTETQGRVHTSTATVLVIPEVENVDIEIKESDIKLDVFHSSGAGGQSVNTSNSAVRLTHIPTGIAVACQTERSQVQNKEQAMKLLKSKINDERNRKFEMEQGNIRKSKIGTGDRSEKIRTYNYPQGRITDHRIGMSIYQMENFLNGDIDEMVDNLIAADRAEKLKGEEE